MNTSNLKKYCKIYNNIKNYEKFYVKISQNTHTLYI